MEEILKHLSQVVSKIKIIIQTMPTLQIKIAHLKLKLYWISLGKNQLGYPLECLVKKINLNYKLNNSSKSICNGKIKIEVKEVWCQEKVNSLQIKKLL